MTRYVVRLEPIASASADDVAVWLGPAIQRHLSEALPSKAHRTRARPRVRPARAAPREQSF